jgi:hypothetical protein
MSIIKLGTEGNSSSVSELITILDIEGCDGNLVYELHNQTSEVEKEPNQEFINRSNDFYKAFVNPLLVDQRASNEISYAAKIKDVWYIAAHTGANTYLGAGPTSTLRIREFCLKKGLKILFVESPLEEWLKISVNANSLIETQDNQIQKKLQEFLFEELFDNPAKICQLLLDEKEKCEVKIMEAKINNNNSIRKYYQQTIDDIIEPKLKYWQSKLEIKNTQPLSEENQGAIKINNSNSTIIDEKINSEIIPTDLECPPSFEQILCDGSEQEILDDFMLLATTKNKVNNECYMKKEDVIEFVKKNFSIFKTKPTGKYFEINLLPKQMTILKHFIYQFTVKYNRKLKIPKEKYALLLINNFELFKSNNPKNLASNISESKKPKSLLDIIHIPKKRLL